MELKDIKGIGPKRIELLHQLGIDSLSDLLTYYPSGYLDYSACTPVSELEDGAFATVQVTLTSGPSWFSRKGLTTITLYGRDEAGKRIALRYFNQPYRAKGLEPGQTFIASGRVHIGEKGAPALINPLLAKELRGIVPVYSTLKGLTQTNLRDGIRSALEGSGLEETLPLELLQKHDLPQRTEALWELHFPTDTKRLEAARRRRAYEDALYYFLASQELKEERKRRNGIAFSAVESLPEYVKTLPFTPTHAQQRVLFEVAKDMASHSPMNRMIEGDVGSGKTGIALFALYAAARDGYQGALMAPTEILARQHYESLKPLFGDECGLLLGSESPREKREALEKLESGAWKAVTGTHALFSQNVRFHKLGVVVTDEQHRFGVSQRAAIEQKGSRPDVLVMSATPIPRTLALILYGDLDLSVIDELPAGRKPVKTHLVGPAKRKDMYRYLAARAREGEQCYVVCPLIERTEGLEGLSVDEVYDEVREIAGDVPLLKLHGRMSEAEKQSAMARFYSGQVPILISTTVIEVGVHVPRATGMVIEGAERFGLSAMHQLRGRVGRGEGQAHCYLVVYEQKKSAMERLQAMLDTSDGFKIAERDLELRGAGDLMGIRQAGEEREEGFLKDCPVSLLEAASVDAAEVYSVPSLKNEQLMEAARLRYRAMGNITMN